MSNSKNRKPGGLILQRADLQTILDEPDTYGLAFALQAPGQSENVDLQVLKVSLVDDRFVGEVRKIPNARKLGVPGPLVYPTGHCSDFEFHYLDKLKEDGYFFGFFNSFSDIFKGREPKDWNQIFIGGGKKTYPEGSFSKDEWFTFTIAVRKELKEFKFAQISEVRKFIRLQHPDKPLIDLPTIKSFGKVDVETLIDTHLNQDNIIGKEVESIIKVGKPGQVKGLVFTDGSKYLFDEYTQVESIQLDEKYCLKTLHFPEDPTVESLPPLDLGAIFPYADHTVGCPPYWPDDFDGEGENAVNLRSAIKNALKEL